MEATVLRRSTRARTQVASYSESHPSESDTISKPVHVAIEHRAQEEIHPSHHLMAKPTTKNRDNKLDKDDAPSDDDLINLTREHDAEPQMKATQASKQPYGLPPAGTLIPWGTSKLRKQPKAYALPASTDTVIKNHIDPPVYQTEDHLEDSYQPKKRKRPSNQFDPETQQLYGHPLHGTMIPWGTTRMRKQPKIYPPLERVTMSSKAIQGNEWIAAAAAQKTSRQISSIKKLKPGQAETHLRTYRDEPPEWYPKFLHSANTQKMIVLERTRGIEEDCHAHHDDCPFESLQIAGSKGNVYTITISHLTTCTCPVGLFSGKNNEKQCKHIIYVLHNVLKAPERLKYQPAFLTSELKQIFANAPPLPNDVANEEAKDGNRKAVEGDCPICFTDFDDGDDIVWCKAACGNNIHKQCFKKWAESKVPVTCPFCRSEWQSETKPGAQVAKIANLHTLAETGPEGYRNVYDQLDYAG